MNSEDIPLSDSFYDNPLQYMQNYVRNLNNQIFLSEYQINNLYTLLLIGRNSPWDNIKGNSESLKEQIDSVVNRKVQDVKTILNSLSNVYEDKAKKSAISQIEKLMAILKSKKKSILIEKDKTVHNHNLRMFMNQIAKQAALKQKHENIHQSSGEPTEAVNIREQQSKHPTVQNGSNAQEQQSLQAIEQTEHTSQENTSKQQQVKASRRGNNEVFSIFYGLANITNLSALALTNILEYNSSERFIKFKMSQHYNMTIKNQDDFHFDRQSSLSNVSSDLYVSHIFPYLSASQLFNVRSVCKEWLQNVKEAWHSTFKREMFTQLLACQFCKDIEFFYKTIQLRNPFFQKLSLLIHALIQIIQWNNVYNSIQANTLSLQLKRILIIILRLIGQPIPLTTLSAINDSFFDQYKDKLMNLRQRVMQFFSTLSGSDMNINDLRLIKVNFLDDPFMRIEEMNSQDKSPLLLTLFAKQMVLQQILRNHIFLCQEYLLNTKKRLDNVSRKMVYQKGYLEGVYKILLLKPSIDPLNDDKQQSQLPNFQEMLQSIFTNKNSDKPDFVIRNRGSSTEVYLDNATKLDLILSTVCNLQEVNCQRKGEQHPQVNRQQRQQRQECQLKKGSNIKITNSIDIKIECKAQSESTSAFESKSEDEAQRQNK